MDENNYDFNNSMDEEEKEKQKAIEEANNTMISINKDMQIKNKMKKEKKSKKDKKENKISNIVNEINDELEEYNTLDIENIFEINNKFNYPKDFPVFYIQDESNDNTENSLFKEPLSSNKIKELLKTKQIKPYLINIKLIDIFSMKNHPPFSFFSLNEILEKNWSKNVEYSTLFNYIHNKLKEKNNKKIDIIPKKIEKKEKIPKKKEEDFSLNLNFSEINKSGFNDLSMSIIKQLEGINLTKKQVEKITSIIEEVEEDEWQEVKSKKKENENNISIGIVGLNQNKQNKKNNKIPKKKKNYINDNNQFKGLKIDYDD